jgi:hypothetical protein
MEDTIELNAFLSKLVAALVKKFEASDAKIRDMKTQIDSLKQIDSSVRDLKVQIDSLKQSNNSNATKMLDEKVRMLETTLNSLKVKSQIDTSILKLIETDDQRKVM